MIVSLETVRWGLYFYDNFLLAFLRSFLLRIEPGDQRSSFIIHIPLAIAAALPEPQMVYLH